MADLNDAIEEALKSLKTVILNIRFTLLSLLYHVTAVCLKSIKITVNIKLENMQAVKLLCKADQTNTYYFHDHESSIAEFPQCHNPFSFHISFVFFPSMRPQPKFYT